MMSWLAGCPLRYGFFWALPWLGCGFFLANGVSIFSGYSGVSALLAGLELRIADFLSSLASALVTFFVFVARVLPSPIWALGLDFSTFLTGEGLESVWCLTLSMG